MADRYSARVQRPAIPMPGYRARTVMCSTHGEWTKKGPGAHCPACKTEAGKKPNAAGKWLK